MPRKLDPDRGPGQKVLALFARMLFSQRRHSLSDLAEFLHCSKQTVLRYLAEIDRMPEIRVARHQEGNRTLYSIPRRRLPHPSEWMTEEELVLLWMCRSFTRNVLGTSQFHAATRALERSARALESVDGTPAASHFSAVQWGGIDYEPHRETLEALVRAMNDRRVCEVSYQRAGASQPKTFHVKPLKIFTHRDTLYVHGEQAKSPGKVYKVPKYQPILAVHRFREVRVTDTPFQFPDNYDFRRSFNRHFGIIQDRTLQVVAEFRDWAAVYVAERTWSDDQEVTWNGDASVRVAFSANSEDEVVSWILSFGECARVVEPEGLAGEVAERARAVVGVYG